GLCVLALSGLAQVSTSQVVQLRIEAVGAHDTYSQDSSFPIRCRFKNVSNAPVTITLPGHGLGQTATTSPLGLEVNIRTENETLPLIRARLDVCRKLAEKMDSKVECDSPGDAINLQPREEFVRTIHLNTLSGFGDLSKKMQPGKYLVQVTSNQVDSILISNEIAIVVQTSDAKH
ncbi:MAG TPA: hypothetical protein VNO32_21480, partial [Candidatus Acidoferrum sp.]|nr:hypothetical protein [Candidatus Acidoferrum sp.]